jgi:hypothetical protein
MAKICKFLVNVIVKDANEGFQVLKKKVIRIFKFQP